MGPCSGCFPCHDSFNLLHTPRRQLTLLISSTPLGEIRDKKAILGDQCKEIEENNIMGKTRDPFKKIRDAKGIFHATMGTIKDINYMDLIEAEDIKKRWQEYTEKLYKNSLYNSDSHDGMITYLEPDILECEVKWALGSITTNIARRRWNSS